MNNPLRVGITCYPSLGGSGVVATELGKMLSEEGHQVHFITSSIPFRLGKYSPNIFFHEVEVNHYSVFRYPPYDLTLASKMAQVAKMEKLDLLHVHYAIPHAICAYLAKQMTDHPLKVITTLHGTDITVLGYDETLRDMIRFGIEQSDVVTAVSNDLIDQTKQMLDIKSPIYNVYNFVDNKKYDNQHEQTFRKCHDIRDDEKLLVHISNFRPVKRVFDVVKIFAAVRDKMKAKLIFIGEGPEYPRVSQWIQDNHFQEDVIFLGKQEDVSGLLTQMDVMLLPSEKESFGLVALEAMAAGVPVVASRTGGIPEVVQHGETGLTYEVGDIESMANGTISILEDATLYRRLSEASITRARDHFDAKMIMNDYISLYRTVLQS